mmetsp:Transcript_62837/g.178662  ORF Transcript_62837/g.178662 Transcript_62837/m.178662 type:complete len:306 (-) Transcript_62837:541-1458(-)
MVHVLRHPHDGFLDRARARGGAERAAAAGDPGRRDVGPVQLPRALAGEAARHRPGLLPVPLREPRRGLRDRPLRPLRRREDGRRPGRLRLRLLPDPGVLLRHGLRRGRRRHARAGPGATAPRPDRAQPLRPAAPRRLRGDGQHPRAAAVASRPSAGRAGLGAGRPGGGREDGLCVHRGLRGQRRARAHATAQQARGRGPSHRGRRAVRGPERPGDPLQRRAPREPAHGGRASPVFWDLGGLHGHIQRVCVARPAGRCTRAARRHPPRVFQRVHLGIGFRLHDRRHTRARLFHRVHLGRRWAHRCV